MHGPPSLPGSEARVESPLTPYACTQPLAKGARRGFENEGPATDGTVPPPTPLGRAPCGLLDLGVEGAGGIYVQLDRHAWRVCVQRCEEYTSRCPVSSMRYTNSTRCCHAASPSVYWQGRWGLRGCHGHQAHRELSKIFGHNCPFKCS